MNPCTCKCSDRDLLMWKEKVQLENIARSSTSGNLNPGISSTSSKGAPKSNPISHRSQLRIASYFLIYYFPLDLHSLLAAPPPSPSTDPARMRTILQAKFLFAPASGVGSHPTQGDPEMAAAVYWLRCLLPSSEDVSIPDLVLRHGDQRPVRRFQEN